MSTAGKGSRLLRYAGQVQGKQTMFRPPFLGPSSCYGGEQSDPEKGCSDTQGAAELSCCFGPALSDPMAWAACVWVCDCRLPVILTCQRRHSPIATGLDDEG